VDWITHYLVAFIIGRRFRLDKERMMAITLGALILDVDIVLYLLPGSLSHGTFTHTLGGALALGAICTFAIYAWKRKWAAPWIALGAFSHISLDMINTLSVFDDGKQLLYPLSDMVFCLKEYVPYPDLVWAVLTAAVFSFSITMLAIYIYQKDYPWRVWYDERPLVEYWRKRFQRS
jgi:membrane-bound metal-dependent hydrolase YbcI (DUF457 family)